jgi:DeoR family transcriptional regulator, fructose operon transcriptional repressor
LAEQAGPAERPSAALYPPERQEAILQMARQHGRVEVGELASTFQVTTETIRRDLAVLDRRRLLRRVHGGAILWTAGAYAPLLTQRDVLHTAEKERIALAAIAELPAAGIVLLDSGSTTASIVQHLPDDAEFTVVTNSVIAAHLLTNHPEIEVTILGGTLDKKTLALVGERTVAELVQMRVDTLLLGTDGMSPSGGFTTPHPRHAEVKRAMVAAARRVIAVADASKAGHDHFLRVATCHEVDTLVTDCGLDEATTRAFEDRGVDVIRT